jgi:hypothetical protein
VAFRSTFMTLASLAFIAPFAFIPLALDAHDLYARGASSVAVPEYAHVWRATTAVIVRALVSFAVPIVVVTLLHRNGGRRSAALGALGLIALFLAATNGAVDWFLAITPHFDSTVFPAIVLASGMTSALALAALTAPHRAVDEAADLATMLFAGLMFWAYVSFAQLLIVWIANLPREVGYYLDRVDGGFEPIAVILIVGAFAIPYFALLFRALKTRRKLVVVAGAWILVGQLLDAVWWIGPPSASSSVAHSTIGYVLGLAVALVAFSLAVLLLFRLARLTSRIR